ncbi:MAG: DUF4286 domain-containing protein [Phycisphaerales bacterium]
MAKVSYCVTATLPDEATAREYLDWLLGGHIEGVLVGGAERAAVVRLDGPPIRIESRYVFPSREAMAAYEAGPAIPLREDGKRRFGDRSVTFERRVGVFENAPLPS